MKEKFLNFLEHINFLADQQFGFRKNRSTDSALFVHITNIVNGIEENNVAVGVYLDLAKAFDTVNHSLMIRKLQTIGFRGPLLDWCAFLFVRKGTVRENRQNIQLKTKFFILSSQKVFQCRSSEEDICSII